MYILLLNAVAIKIQFLNFKIDFVCPYFFISIIDDWWWFLKIPLLKHMSMLLYGGIFQFDMHVEILNT
jgi:hypothetical protein